MLLLNCKGIFHILTKIIIEYFVYCKRKKYRGINCKFAIVSFIKNNKWLLIFLLVSAVLGLITGILVAIKSGVCVDDLSNLHLVIYYHDGTVVFAGVWDKCWSIFLNLAIISVAALYVLLLPLGFIVVVYRAYLVGFNLALLCCLFGIGGALKSLLILLPCQICILAIMIIFTILMVNISDSKKRFGRPNHSFFKVFILALVIMLVICIVECLLLSIFSASTILVL